MKKLWFVFVLFLLPLASSAQIFRQPGISRLTIIETRRAVQHVSHQTISVSRSGRIVMRTTGARGSAQPIHGVGSLRGRMESDGSFETEGKMGGKFASASGKIDRKGRFTVTQIVEDSEVEIRGRAAIGGFGVTGSYSYLLDGDKVTGRIIGAFHPAP